MKSYLEMTWLVSAVMFYVCFHIASVLLHLSFARKKTAIFCIGYAVFAEQMCKGWILFLLVHLCASLVLYPRKFLAATESLFLYLSLAYAFQMCSSVEMQNVFLYIRSDSYTGFWICFILLALDWYAVHCFFPFDQKAQLYFPVTVQIHQQRFECIGFLDTGNHAEYQGMPVVFVKTPIECSFVIEVKGIQSTAMLSAAYAQIQVEGKTYCAVAAYSDDLQVECLLHSCMG